MKKFASLVSSALLTLSLATPALAQYNIGVGKPDEVRILDLGKLISVGINVVIIISGILVFVYLVWGGLTWLTAGADKNKTQEAQAKITNALVGLAIIAASWALLRIIAYFFGVEAGIDKPLNIPRPY